MTPSPIECWDVRCAGHGGYNCAEIKDEGSYSGEYLRTFRRDFPPVPIGLRDEGGRQQGCRRESDLEERSVATCHDALMVPARRLRLKVA